LATTAAVLLGALLLTLLVFRLPIAASLRLIEEGALGDKFGLSRTAVKTSPLLLTGLGVIVAWRAGMYNIGGEGQFIIGGLAGAWMATRASENALWIAPILLACAVGGAFWAAIAAWLYVKRGVAPVISTILLNFIALQVLDWAVSGPLQQKKGEVPLTEQLPDALMLPKFDRQMDAHAGVLIALFVAFFVYAFLFRTTWGYRLRLVGDSPSVARANRISVSASQVLAMAISGGLCGLAGGIEYAGMTGQLGVGFSQQWGFLGIPVALLAGLHPLSAIPSAIYFGAVFAGSENLARFTPGGTTLIYVIQAVAVLAFAAIQSRRKLSRLEAQGE
jgi:simple sugar transport system permease protein